MSDTVIQSIFQWSFLAAILRVATPILLPSLGALISGRAGVTNIGLEGLMLSSAFTGVIVSAYSQSWFGPEVGNVIGPWLGMVMGVTVSILMALMLGFFHLKLKADLILSGIAINILGSSATVAIMFELTGDRGNTSTLSSLRMPFIQLPTFLREIPLLGPFIYDTFNNQNIMTWVAFISIAVVWFVLYRTPFGMHLRATGENAAAAESVGIGVTRIRYTALALSGLFAGLGGIHMSMGYLSLFQRDMTSGRGFIALAAPLLGGNTPIGTGIAALVFGFFDAFGVKIGTLQIPSQVPQLIPYIATVMALVVYALQGQLRVRVRALRAAEGEGFDAGFWSVVQRLSVLHMLQTMVAVLGIVVTISLFVAPKGFGGESVAYPIAATIGVISLIIIGLNLPFITKVESIPTHAWRSAGTSTLTLGVYFALFLSIFLDLIVALIVGIVLGAVLWLVMGGWRLLRPQNQLAAA